MSSHINIPTPQSSTHHTHLYTASVNASRAGSPFFMLYLIPKSSSGPPGLWLAVRMMPPTAAPPSRSLWGELVDSFGWVSRLDF